MGITLKSKLRNRKVTVGSWITIGDTSVAEIMAKAGFEWLTIDMEHSAITLDQANRLIQVIELSGVTALVRVGENDPLLIKRVMDSGAHGVIVPMVNTREDALRAVNAVRYPPYGERGVGLARAQGYGLEFERYKTWLSNESVVIVQIEHIKGVENLEDILSVEGVDAFLVGPYDLTASLGHPGQFNHPAMLAALKRIKEVSKLSRVPAGFHVIQPDISFLRGKIQEGYTFLAFCFDALFLNISCRESLLKIKAYTQRHKL